MPTLLQMRVPLTASGSEFEDIVRSALKVRWTSPNLQRYGRNGQSQFGVDISGPDDLKRFVGIQCKSQDLMTIKEIAVAATAAEAFEPAIEAFYLATGHPRDAKLQRAVMLLSDQRKKNGKCPVGVLFWDDIYEDLVTDMDEFAKHYPQFVAPRYVPNPSVTAIGNLAGRDQYMAAQAIYALARGLTKDLPRRPDIEWDDVLEYIAWDFDTTATQISELLEKFSVVLPDKLQSGLQNSLQICRTGRDHVQVTDEGPEVDFVAHEHANRLNTLLQETAEEARSWIQGLLKG